MQLLKKPKTKFNNLNYVTLTQRNVRKLNVSFRVCFQKKMQNKQPKMNEMKAKHNNWNHRTLLYIIFTYKHTNTHTHTNKQSNFFCVNMISVCISFLLPSVSNNPLLNRSFMFFTRLRTCVCVHRTVAYMHTHTYMFKMQCNTYKHTCYIHTFIKSQRAVLRHVT